MGEGRRLSRAPSRDPDSGGLAGFARRAARPRSGFQPAATRGLVAACEAGGTGGQLLTGRGGAPGGGPRLAAPRQRIENVVAAARLGGPFDVPVLARRLKEAEYRPDRFVGLVLRVPKGHALVFEDGQVVATGARAVEEALVQMEHVRELLAQAGADTTGVDGFTVRNLVVSAEAGGRLGLDQVMLAFPEEDMEYEPERFPGLIVHLSMPRVTLLVFPSGRVVATGSGDMPEVEEALEGFVRAVRDRQLVSPSDEEDEIGGGADAQEDTEA